MSRDFWKSAGMHLLAPTPEGWLGVTPAFIRAYLKRPEIHPIETSCAAEVGLHELLMDDPFRPVSTADLAALADGDTADNYRMVIGFRDVLAEAGTIEGAYLRLVSDASNTPRVPPVFLDQLVHLICRNMLKDAVDPIRLRAGEFLFREQTVSTEGGRLMCADEEIVEMHARSSGTGLAQLLAETGTPMRSMSLDVLDADNAEGYWARSERFDTVVDLRFGQPALDALARVIETWLAHLMRVETRVEPRMKLEDRDWRWHIGLDARGTEVLNALYEGRNVALSDMERIVALFRMTIGDDRIVIDRVKGRPIYLALAMTADNVIKMKPQNLLVNLPLARPS